MCAASTRIWATPFDGSFRLSGGETVNEGLLEVYCGGEWGTVCDDHFTLSDATDVCRRLGYTRATNYDHLNM